MMMTVTTTIMNNPKDAQEINLESELALNDLNFIENPDKPVSISEPLSLPAALCDDKLLEEINSIPDKMGFKIGDVAELLGIKQYVLRYWESEFEILKPKKASNNQRMYTRKDVENAFLIRKLLHRDRFSIEGARNALKELKNFVRKEKDYSQVVHKLESYHDRVASLAIEIRRVRQLFR
jgi:DNA-binding transcriptional MerR regulator